MITLKGPSKGTLIGKRTKVTLQNVINKEYKDSRVAYGKILNTC
jgi:hypothetical protein